VFERAHREAAEAQRIAEEVGDPIPAIWALSWGGLAFQSLGDIETAEAKFRDAVERARAAKNPRGVAGVLGNLAVLVLEERGDAVEARALLGEAITLINEFGLDQAFGGRRREEFNELLARAEKAADD
jgi:tetratricopeptide (TPR) repeat protein